MRTIENNILEGNFGESLVSFKLSDYCLVRQVSSGTDIGIDLYCESIDPQKRPFVHFWIQVKTGSEPYIKISKDGKSATFKFDTSHLEYWKNQPVPVFVFLVPRKFNNHAAIFRFYVINITEYLINHNIDGKYKSIKSSLIINNQEILESFISKVVPRTSAKQKIREGILAPLPSNDQQYESSLFSEDSRKHLKKILFTIRTTVAFTASDIINHRGIDIENYTDELNHLEQILKTFIKNENWEVHFYLGRCSHLKGDFKDAYRFYEKSIEIINADNKLENFEQWKNKKSEIKNYKLLASSSKII